MTIPRAPRPRVDQDRTLASLCDGIQSGVRDLFLQVCCTEHLCTCARAIVEATVIAKSGIAAWSLPICTLQIVQVRVYDSHHHDYHNWDEREDHAYRRYLAKRHEEYHEYSTWHHKEQQNYWNWRHHHPDHD
jgi:hypothetical protein